MGSRSPDSVASRRLDVGAYVVEAGHQKSDSLRKHVQEVLPFRDEHVVQAAADEQDPPAQLREVAPGPRPNVTVAFKSQNSTTRARIPFPAPEGSFRRRLGSYGQKWLVRVRRAGDSHERLDLKLRLERVAQLLSDDPLVHSASFQQAHHSSLYSMQRHRVVEEHPEQRQMKRPE